MKNISGLSSFYKYYFYESLNSTSDEVKALARNNYPEGTLVHAFEQKKGRGRAGKKWISLPGNLFFSILLRPFVSVKFVPQLSLVISLSVIKSLEKIIGSKKDLMLKWPNDVLLQDKKIAGILLESSFLSENNLEWVVIGIGLNVLGSPDNEKNSTCLTKFGYNLDQIKILTSISNEIEHHYKQWKNQGFQEIRSDWLKYSYPIGKKMSLKLNQDCIYGAFDGINEDGSLILKQNNEKQKIISGGDVNII